MDYFSHPGAAGAAVLSQRSALCGHRGNHPNPGRDCRAALHLGGHPGRKPPAEGKSLKTGAEAKGKTGPQGGQAEAQSRQAAGQSPKKESPTSSLPGQTRGFHVGTRREKRRLRPGQVSSENQAGLGRQGFQGRRVHHHGEGSGGAAAPMLSQRKVSVAASAVSTSHHRHQCGGPGRLHHRHPLRTGSSRSEHHLGAAGGVRRRCKTQRRLHPAGFWQKKARTIPLPVLPPPQSQSIHPQPGRLSTKRM